MSECDELTPRRWAEAVVDLVALRENVKLLCSSSEDAAAWAVVKADAYGHGAVRVARAALEAGAAGLCVALTHEGVELRTAGIDAPILLLSQQPPEHADALIEHCLTPTVYTADGIDAVATAAQRAGVESVGVHVKIDTGMQRVGAKIDEADSIVSMVEVCPSTRLTGIFTHLAVADSLRPEHVDFTDGQIKRFGELLGRLDLDEGVVVHIANSAGTLARRRIDGQERHSWAVRLGIAMYGLTPGAGVDHLTEGLQPVMSLTARVSHLKEVREGSAISYGLRHHFDSETTVATVPLGYADGVPRRLWATGGEVLIAGRRCPIVGVITMDQLMVDVGPLVNDGVAVAVGDDVVLIGQQGNDMITADDWAESLDTIGYEIVCGISPRVPRVARHQTPSTP